MRVSRKIGVTLTIAALITTLANVGGSPTPASAQGEQQYLLLGRGGSLPADFEAMMASIGGRVIMAFPEIGVALVASSDPGFRIAAGALPGVQSVVPDGTMGVDQVSMAGAVAEEIVMESAGVVAEGVPAVNPNQPYYNHMAVAQAWSVGQMGAGVTVAVIDTGIDYMHQELAGKVDMARSKSLIGEIVPGGRQPFADTSFPGHGTAIASMIAGKGVRAAGVAPLAQLVSIKVLDRNGIGQESTVIAAILYAASLKVDVINMSFGFVIKKRELGIDDDGDNEWVRSQQLEALRRAIRHADRSGAVMVSSAGNTATNRDLDKTVVKAPAGIRPVVGVSATTLLDGFAPFSDFGYSLVTVSAPGERVYGAANTLYLPPRPSPSGLLYPYVMSTGTSASSAIASGVSALIAGVCAGNIDEDRVREKLRKSVDDKGAPGRDAYFGAGRLNALKAVSGKIRCERSHRDKDDDDDDEDDD